MFRLFSVLAVALATTGAVPVTARAHEPCCTYKTVVCRAQVTHYVKKTIACPKQVICYDECGRPYTLTKVEYKEVTIPVTRTVLVTKRAKVCD